MQYWFWSITLRILPSHPSSIHYTPSSGHGTVHLDDTLPLSLSTTTFPKIITSQGSHPWLGVILIFPNSNCPYSKTLFQAVTWTQATKLLILILERLVQHLRPFLSSLIHKTHPTYVTTIKVKRTIRDSWISQHLFHHTEPITSRTNPQLFHIGFVKPGYNVCVDAWRQSSYRQAVHTIWLFQILPNVSDFTILPTTRPLIRPRSYSNTIKIIQTQIQWSINPTILYQYPISNHNQWNPNIQP